MESLINVIENAVVSVLNEKRVESDILFHVTNKLKESSLPHVGYILHSLQLTRCILSFYLTTRMFFVAKQYNRNNEERGKVKEKRKSAKLVNAGGAINL